MPDEKERLKKLKQKRAQHLQKAKSFKTAKEAAAWEKKRKEYDNAVINTSKKTGDFKTSAHSKSLGTERSQKVDKNSIAVKNSSIDRITKMNNANWSKSKTGMPGAHKRKSK